MIQKSIPENKFAYNCKICGKRCPKKAPMFEVCISMHLCYGCWAKLCAKKPRGL